MPTKREIQRCNAEEALACRLPFNILASITSHLGAKDKGALSLTHPDFAQYFRATRERCVARVADRQQLKQLSRALEKHKALARLNIIFLGDKPCLTYLSFLCPTTADLELRFRGEQPTKRSFSWLSSNIFSSLERLTLAGESDRNRRLNGDGRLSILAGLHSLTNLKLVNLHSDRGLEKVTQLTSLHIVYPNHEAAAPHNPLCPVCNTLHEPCWQDYLLEALENEEVVIGDSISSLPLLKNLTLDFNAALDDMSFSSLLNHFHWYGPKESNAFPALETLSLVNTLNFDENYYPIPVLAEPAVECYASSGYAMWNGFTLARCCDSLPALQHGKLYADSEWIDRHSGTCAVLKELGKGLYYTCSRVAPGNNGGEQAFLDFVPLKKPDNFPCSASDE